MILKIVLVSILGFQTPCEERPQKPAQKTFWAGIVIPIQIPQVVIS